MAMIACMRKLLTAIYSVAKHRRPFVQAPRTQAGVMEAT
jgi:hypothetical protein